MGKLLIFSLLWWLFGNPFVAILVLLVVLYFLDRRFIGLSPSFVKPLRRRRLIGKYRQQLALNPNDVSVKMDIARLLIEKKSYAEARKWLESIGAVMEHSAEYWDDLGTAWLYTGELDRGEQAIRKALSINERVKYGQPYLRLAAMRAKSDPTEALRDLEAFRSIHSSSCEAYYRMGAIYTLMGRKQEAQEAYEQCSEIYRTLPKYKRRQERQWVIRSFFRKLMR